MNHREVGSSGLTVLHRVPVWLPQTQTWLYNQLRYLPSWIESHVVCDTDENLDQFPWPHVSSFSRASKRRIYWDKLLRRLGWRHHYGFVTAAARNAGAQLMHSHFGHVGWANAAVARALNIPHVVTFYGFDVNMLPTQDSRWRGRYAELFAGVDRVLCEGSHMAARVAELGCGEDRIRVHHLGVELQHIPFQPRSWRPGETLKVLAAASFREKKGLPYGIEALGRIARKMPVQLTIMGDAGSDAASQAEKQRILSAIADSGLAEFTNRVGYQPQSVLWELAHDHHVFLSPSVTAADGDTEGGVPVVLIEMVASGMPVIATRHCDVPDVILEGRTGWLAPERDVDGLEAVMNRWLDQPDAWASMLTAGRKHVEAAYDVRRQGEALAEIYQQLR